MAINILEGATARRARRDWGSEAVGGVRSLALAGAVLLGASVPAVASATGILAGAGSIAVPRGGSPTHQGGGRTGTATPAADYIIVLRPAAGESGAFASAAAARLGFAVLDTWHVALSGFAATLTPSARLALAADPLVAAVEPDRPIHALGQAIPTGIHRVHADLSPGAAIDAVDQPRIDVNVAVLDTGIDIEHPDLNVAGGHDCSKSRGYDDRYGHGTHAAGIIGALDNNLGVVGVAPGANMYGVKVLDDQGDGTTRELLCGIEWVTSTRTDTDEHNDIAVANLSLGGVGSDDGHCGRSDSDVLHQAVCRSVAAGVTYVVAAGNDHEDASHLVPAAYGEVITVSALADSDGKPGGDGGAPECRSDQDDTLADFSNYGPSVDLVAPGVCIYSTLPVGHTTLGDSGGYGTLTGTSFAAPHVAGAAALWMSRHRAATPAEVRQALLSAGNKDWNDRDDPDGIKEPALDVTSF